MKNVLTKFAENGCLFISNIILHHAQCIQFVGFTNFMVTPFFNERAISPGRT